MKATKYTLTVTAEALSKDSFPGLLRKLAQEVYDEAASGEIVMDDGDRVTWDTKSKEVTF